MDRRPTYRRIISRRLSVVILCVMMSGAVGGYALGGFATQGSHAREQQTGWWTSETSAENSASSASPSSSTPADNGPKNYVCKGCGPTLAERRINTLYGPVDSDYQTSDASRSAHLADSAMSVQLPDLTQPAAIQ